MASSMGCLAIVSSPESCVNAPTSFDPASSAVLMAAYARHMTIVARLVNPYHIRDHADHFQAPSEQYQSHSASELDCPRFPEHLG